MSSLFRVPAFVRSFVRSFVRCKVTKAMRLFVVVDGIRLNEAVVGFGQSYSGGGSTRGLGLRHGDQMHQ